MDPQTGTSRAAPDHLEGLERVRVALERHAAREPGQEPAPPPAPLPLPDRGDGPLASLCQRFGLSSFERDVLLLCAGMEVDASFGPLCSRAQVHPDRDYPTFGLALAVFGGGSWQALLPDAPLRYWQLLQLAPDAGLTAARLTIDERVLHYLLGFDSRDERLAGLARPMEMKEDLVPSHRRLAQRLARTWNRTQGSSDFPVLELCGSDTRSKWAVAAATCDLVDHRLYVLAAESLPTSTADLDRLLRLWHREALLSRSALLVAADDLRPDDGAEAALRRFVDQARSAVVVTRRKRLPPRHRPVLSVDVDKPGLEEQREVWQRTLEGLEAAGVRVGNGDLEARVEALVDAFHLSASEIRSAGFEALGRVEPDPEEAGHGEETAGETGADGPIPATPAPDLADALWQTCRTRVRPALTDLAELLEPGATWETLVLPSEQRRTLREIVAHVRQRGTVYRRWGFGATSSRGQGVSALFGGPSGTGKTLAAEVLSGELGLDLYRIDLSSVISKYIGETEKNLQQIFDAAEAGGAILLFDEADALFGKRSEVKDSHDRYANIEVSYLLQRMESYRGLAILTTNLPDALDPAFRRRLRFIVHFPFPDVDQRRELWRRVFPASTPVEGLDHDRLARLNVAGGHVRNIALHAAFRAAETDRPVTMADLQAAAHQEMVKAGRPLSEAETRDWVE